MEQEVSRREKRKRYRKIRIAVCYAVLAIVSLVVFVYAASNLVGYYADHRKEEALKEELSSLRRGSQAENEADAEEKAKTEDALKVQRTPEEIAAFYQMMQAKNEDYVFWLTIDGTSVDYPVVKKDNSFYLNHDFEGKKNRHGSIFLDETCDPGDEVLLIHGHHMKDGTMFGDLKKYKDDAFRERYGTVSLEREDGVYAYRIFAVAQIDLTDEDSFRFETMPKTEEEKVLYIEGLDAASFWYEENLADETLQDTSLIVLSTCDYGTEEERLLVAAREIVSP